MMTPRPPLSVALAAAGLAVPLYGLQSQAGRERGDRRGRAGVREAGDARAHVRNARSTRRAWSPPSRGSTGPSPRPRRRASPRCRKAEGERVKAGDLLVRFDIPTLAADVAAKEADVAQAQRAAGHGEGRARAHDGPRRARRRRARRIRKPRRRAGAGRGGARAGARRGRCRARPAATAPSCARASRASSRSAGTTRAISSRRRRAIRSLRVIDPTRLQVVASVPVGDLGRVMPRPAARGSTSAAGDERRAGHGAQRARRRSIPASATADVRLDVQRRRRT